MDPLCWVVLRAYWAVRRDGYQVSKMVYLHTFLFACLAVLAIAGCIVFTYFLTKDQAKAAMGGVLVAGAAWLAVLYLQAAVILRTGV